MPIETGTLSTGRKVCFGCRSTPRNRLAKAHWVFQHARALPPPLPDFDATGGVKDWDMYGNDQYGVCTTAEEGNYKKCIGPATDAPEVKIPTQNLISWARNHGFLNGADLDEVLNAMERDGLPDAAGVVHRNGNHGTIDWTDKTEFQWAVQYFKGIKIAVGAAQLLRVVGDGNGWLLDRAYEDQSANHCVGIYGYGTVEFLSKICGLSSPPGNVDPKAFAVLLYTWETIGIVTWPSFLALTSEAWVRITDPDRGDRAIWDPLAATDYEAITNETPHPPEPPNPDPNPEPDPGPGPRPRPRPRPTRRAIALALAFADRYDEDPDSVLSQLDDLEAKFMK